MLAQCRICGSAGHLVWKCSERSGDRWTPENVRCAICGELFHVTADCRLARPGFQAFVVNSYLNDIMFKRDAQELILEIINSPDASYDHRDANFIGKTFLHCACERGHAQVVSSLVDAEVDLEVRDHFGRGVLHYLKKLSKETKRTEILQIIIDAGFHIDRNKYEQCVIPMSYAIRKNWLKRKIMRNVLEEIGISEWFADVEEFLDFLFQPKTTLNLFMSLPPS